MGMKFTVWQRKPGRTKHGLLESLGRDIEEFEVQLVHWTGEGSEPGTECRAISISVDQEGGVTVEHSTSETTGTGIDPESITRVYLPGWTE